MNTTDKARRQAYKRALQRINTVLWEDWDPIGAGVPEDEYESYAPPILRLLLDGADKTAISNYLFATAANTIACPITREHADHVAQMLLDLDLS